MKHALIILLILVGLIGFVWLGSSGAESPEFEYRYQN